MFHDSLLLRLQDAIFAVGFLKLKWNLHEKCEHYRKSHKMEGNLTEKSERNMQY